MKKIVMCFIILAITLLFLLLVVYKLIALHCGRSTRPDYTAIRKRNSLLLAKCHTSETITLKTEDGLYLKGTLIERKEAQRILLICHGRWQSKEFLYPLADLFTKDTLFFLDFRAHGESEGSLISFGLHETRDIRAAVKFLQRYNTNDMYGIGFSMGAVALLKAAYEGSMFKALVIDSAFAELPVQLSRSFTRTTNLPSCMIGLGSYIYEILLRDKIEGVNGRIYVQALSTPLLFIHSATDKIVPVEDAYELYKCAQGKKELWVVQEARHAYIYKNFPEAYKRTVAAFFSEVKNREKIDG